MNSNPFHDLYLSEAIPEDELVGLFSPVIVKHSLAMFEAGHLVISGLQGAGKTMLLNLLRPETRIAYVAAGEQFPVPKELSKFIGAGINLRKCGALEFVQHIDDEKDLARIQELQLLFADFVNYWIVSDIVATIRALVQTKNRLLLEEIGVSADQSKLDKFAEVLAGDFCWFGALAGVSSFTDLDNRIAGRIDDYRHFLNLNRSLPESVLITKTVVGDPIVKTADALRLAGVIDRDTKIFIRIDQYEQLLTLDVLNTKFGSGCQELIHKALASRDGRISYRVGTRNYGWPDRPTIYKTKDVLERKRDFDVFNISELVRRRENSRTWIFPELAEDIFVRRLRITEYGLRQPQCHLKDVLGKNQRPAARAASYFNSKASENLTLKQAAETLTTKVSPAWIEYVNALADRSLLDAWLALAWIRQKLARPAGHDVLAIPPVLPNLPWSKQPYWYKERVQQGLMQLASANRQALLWSGEDDILGLSGGQIIVFLFLLQHVWDAWLRDRRQGSADQWSFPIDDVIQSQGVLEASGEWKSKLIEGSNSLKRKQFVDLVGERMYRNLVDDRAMSYPGANGFSVSVLDLEENEVLRRFLNDATAFGDLYEAAHTSKKKGEQRRKYYIAPILCPFFRIPYVRVKEPEYVSIADVADWYNGRKKRGKRLAQQDDLWAGEP
jgi:hypothetical protein